MIGKNLKKLRELKGFTQKELGEKIGVTQKDLSRWENDIVLPNIENIKKISDILNVSIDDLIKNNELKKDTKKASINNIYLKIGQYIKIDDKEYKLISASLNLNGTYKLKLRHETSYVKGKEKFIDEINILDDELAKLLNLDILGFID